MKIASQLGVFVIALVVSGCGLSFQRWQYRAAVRSAEHHDYKTALERFSRVMRRAPEQPVALEAARRGARIAQFELKRYSQAYEFYHHIVLYSPLVKERIGAQKAIADLYFEKILDYGQAVVEYSRLIQLLPFEERPPYRLLIAKAEYNLNNFNQALVEIEEVLNGPIKPSAHVQFEALLFKGHLLQSSKNLSEAIKIFVSIMKKYPDRAKREHVGLNLAICYEEKADFLKAIEVLENMKGHYPTPDFIQVRINRLKDRLANLPGAQGFKR